MNLEKAKIILNSEGYCYFNLEDFNSTYVKELEDIKYKSENSEYLENFKVIRFDYHNDDTNVHVNLKKYFETFEDLNIEKEKILNEYDYEHISQIWHISESSLFDKFSHILHSLIEYFYKENISSLNISTQWTCYSENCFLKEHNDGQGIGGSNNICAILIYLNEEWEKDWGGSLIIKNNKKITNKKVECEIVPKFGTVAIIDLKTFDTVHAVNKIIGNHNRCTLLAFVSHKE